jgi:hypothetical protein
VFILSEAFLGNGSCSPSTRQAPKLKPSKRPFSPECPKPPCLADGSLPTHGSLPPESPLQENEGPGDRLITPVGPARFQTPEFWRFWGSPQWGSSYPPAPGA